MTIYRIEHHDPQYAGTFVGGIEAHSEEETIQNFIMGNIGTEWISRIKIVSMTLLPDNAQKEVES